MAAQSRFVMCKPHKWHVQEMGNGPLVLLIHGAGGGTQSWRHLMPLLAQHYRVVAMDLPGQGFTRLGTKQRCGLKPMADDIAALCRAQAWDPVAVIGHSAGAAIALEMTQKLNPTPPVIGINAALGNFRGVAGLLFPMMAKALAMTPWVAHAFTASAARPGSVTRLIEGTGSQLHPDDLQWYRALVSDRAHVDGTLAMMAQWNLTPLLNNLTAHPAETLLIAASNDKAVPPDTSETVSRQMPRGKVTFLPDLGHLAHEENAGVVAKTILSYFGSKLAF